jgi:hypothetical protein
MVGGTRTQRYKKEPQASSQRLLENFNAVQKASRAGRDHSSGAAELDRPTMRRKIARASGDHETSRRFQRAAFEFEPEKARFIDGAGKRKPERMAAGKAEGFVLSRVADEQDGFVPGARRTQQSLRH